MIKKNTRYLFLLSAILFPLGLLAQVHIYGGPIYLSNSSLLAISGDLSSESQISGEGTILLNGTSVQRVDLNGNSLPKLAINNSTHINLDSDLHISQQLEFIQGKIFTNAYQLTLQEAAVTLGQGAGKFIETNGAGTVQKLMTTNMNDVIIPLGNGSTYNPILLTSNGTYTNAFVQLQSKNVAHPMKHVRSTDYLNEYWTFSQGGINGTLTARGVYDDNTQLTGNENLLQGIFWNGNQWQTVGSGINTNNNEASATITGNGDLYAMNKFVLLDAKIFLQAAYETSTGLMDDNLRNPGSYQPGSYPAANLLPLNDPYRISPLNQNFTHTSNPLPEQISTTVLQDQVNEANNIVDWVFIELRDNAGSNPGANIVQTRSALLSKNGRIVDIDGVSPVYFNNVEANSNYTIAIRHRNHIGLSTDPSALPQSLSVSATALDFTGLTDNQLFGTANAYTVSQGKTMLWAGNSNGNNSVRYNGPANDRDYILGTVLNGNQGAIINDVYHPGDLNLNRTIRYNGPANDRDYLLSIPLGGNQGSILTQALPTN